VETAEELQDVASRLAEGDFERGPPAWGVAGSDPLFLQLYEPFPCQSALRNVRAGSANAEDHQPAT
jgi:hypothetical protein